MNEINKTNAIEEKHQNETVENQFSICNEGCCSPEFSEGCIDCDWYETPTDEKTPEFS